MIALIRVGTVDMLRNRPNLGIPWRESPQDFLIIGFEMWESSLPAVTQGSFFKFHFYFILEYNWLTVSCFRCTAKWFRFIHTHTHTHTHIHSFSDSFLILVITKCWIEFSVLYSRSLLMIYLSVCILLKPNSWFISPPPPFSPLVTIYLIQVWFWSLWVCFCFVDKFICIRLDGESCCIMLASAVRGFSCGCL